MLQKLNFDLKNLGHPQIRLTGNRGFFNILSIFFGGVFKVIATPNFLLLVQFSCLLRFSFISQCIKIVSEYSITFFKIADGFFDII